MDRTREQVHAELTENVRAAIKELRDITGLSVRSIDISFADVTTYGNVRVEQELTRVRITYE